MKITLKGVINALLSSLPALVKLFGALSKVTQKIDVETIGAAILDAGAGELVDDVLDRNVAAIDKGEAASEQGERAFRELKIAFQMAKTASQVESPDEITGDEGVAISNQFAIAGREFAGIGDVFRDAEIALAQLAVDLKAAKSIVVAEGKKTKSKK